MGFSPLGSVPFFIKLPIAIILDIITGVSSLSLIIGFAIPVSIPIGIFAGIVGALLTSLFLILFYSFHPAIVAVGGFSKILPFFNMIPLATIIALWNGYKTGWRY